MKQVFTIAAPGVGQNEAAHSTLGERHYSPAELAELWSLSVETLRRMFEQEPGVLIFENPERASDRRRRTMRIPEPVVERVYRRLSTRGLDRRR